MPLWQAFVFSPGKDLNSKAGVLYLESGESHVNSRLWTTFDDSESVETEGAVFWRLRCGPSSDKFGQTQRSATDSEHLS